MKKFKITLKANDTEYIGSADTLEDAIDLIKPDKFKTMGVLEIKHGDKTALRGMNIVQMKRLFFNQYTKAVAVKNLKTILNI